jgi:hypothetical protein
VLHWGCCESDLIIHYHVERASHAVRGELAQVERFLHHSFPCKCRVAVNQQCHPTDAIMIVDAVLFGASATQGNRIDEFQVAWIETEREMNPLASSCYPICAVAKMVLHVATAGIGFPIGIRDTHGRSVGHSCP